MSNLLGDDLQVSQPSDDSLAREGAEWIRDLKSRVQNFVKTMFNADTGLLKDGVVKSKMLTTLDPDPAGTWERVTVNNKGQVTRGESVDLTPRPPSIYQAMFGWGVSIEVSGRVFDHVTEAWTSVAGTIDANQLVFSWLVPEGVTQVKARIWGAGTGGDYDVGDTVGGGKGGGYMEVLLPVTPGESALIKIGQGGAAGSGGDGSAGGTTSVNNPSIDGASFGGNGVDHVAGTSTSGVVLYLEGLASATKVGGAGASSFTGASAISVGGDPEGNDGGAGGATPTAGGMGAIVLEYVY